MKVAVISHHRSGTHFLMRAIAENSSFRDKPFWNLDYSTGVDIWATPVLKKYLRRHKGKSIREIMKCHYSVEFFEGMLDLFTSEFYVFYLIRHPEDVMASYYRFSKKLKWLEAPDCDDLSGFIRAEPSGSCLRFQRYQYTSMIRRWSSHVEGWLEAADHFNICVIRYEDLLLNYGETLSEIGNLIGFTPKTEKMPGLTGIQPWQGGDHRKLYSISDREFINCNVGKFVLNLWAPRS